MTICVSRPAPYFDLERCGYAFPQTEDGGQVKGDGEAGQGGHAACGPLFFVAAREDASCHTDFTSLVIGLVGRLVLSSPSIRANEVFDYS